MIDVANYLRLPGSDSDSSSAFAAGDSNSSSVATFCLALVAFLLLVVYACKRDIAAVIKACTAGGGEKQEIIREDNTNADADAGITDISGGEGRSSDSRVLKPLKGPKPIPLLGSLHLLGQHEIPFQAFTELSSSFGPVFGIRLGSTDCVVVNDVRTRDEVLINKANDFDGRPDFERFRILFGGEKQHSLAFCDWSVAQARRREMLQHFTFPHSHSANWMQLDDVCLEECRELVDHVSRVIVDGGEDSAEVDIRPVVMKACANIFNRYFCAGRRMDYSDPELCRYVDNFDRIFWEVNTGRLADFIPSLTPFAFLPIYQSQQSAKIVRSFVQDQLITPRQEELQEESFSDAAADTAGTAHIFLDAMLPYLDGTKSFGPSTPDNNNGVYSNNSFKNNSRLEDSESAMYALEDILGGFEAVGCMVVRILQDLCDNPDSQSSVHLEALSLSSSSSAPAHSLVNAADLHWSRAALFETVRLTCSPIVPHRANRDTDIDGFAVKKDTVVFVNNHRLSFAEEYWGKDEDGDQDNKQYRPRRFLKEAALRSCKKASKPESFASASPSLRFSRPPHFKPFSHGKRSCMGYKLVENVCTVLTVAVVSHFRLDHGEKRNRLPAGLLGLPQEPVKMRLSLREGC